MDIKKYLHKNKQIIDKAMEKYLSISGSPKTIIDSMKYSCLLPGKRIRPILVLAACEAVGGNISCAVSTACALEFIHVFSLIHDDLPAMDNDDWRRGSPSNHKKFGEAMAILAGDALITLSFSIIAQDKKLDDRQKSNIILEISKSIGPLGLVGGQVYDLQFEGKKITFDELKLIHLMKTAPLITSAVVCGGIIGGATKDGLKSLAKFGRHLGLAFQIVDDILDIEGSFEKTGKAPGKDLKKKKATYPALIGIEKSKDFAAREINMALSSLNKFGSRAEYLRKIASYSIKREN